MKSYNSSGEKSKQFSSENSHKEIIEESKEITHKDYSTFNDKNKILIKNDYQKLIQETKVEHLETESIRNDECTGI